MVLSLGPCPERYSKRRRTASGEKTPGLQPRCARAETVALQQGANVKDKEQIVDNWLPRYTGVPLDGFGEHILLTNFGGYLGHFARLMGIEVVGADRPMPSATAD